MKIDLPYFSQLSDVNDVSWRDKACGVVCVKMVLDFYKKENKVGIDELIKEGIEIGAHGDSGWIHDGLVRIFHNHGVLAYKEEFRTRNDEHDEMIFFAGINKLISSLDSNSPVLVSVLGKKGGYHLVVLTGYEMNNEELSGFYFNDPDQVSSADGKDRFIAIDDFQDSWRRLSVITYEI